MKVVKPDSLLREAADVLAPVRDDVVVIGATAVQIALAGREAAVTPTRDIDAGTRTEAVDRIVARLEQAGMTRSTEPHESGFTWVRGTLKVQLIRPYHPFPRGRAANFPSTTRSPSSSVTAWPSRSTTNRGSHACGAPTPRRLSA